MTMDHERTQALPASELPGAHQPVAPAPVPTAPGAVGRANPILPMADPTGGARGATKVDREVVEKLAGTAAREVPGVVDLGGDVRRFFTSVLDKVGLGGLDDIEDNGVRAKVEGHTVTVNIVIVIDAAYHVHEVTETVRARVTEAIERFGLHVAQVNLKVDDVELGRAGKPTEPPA
jgi:uncharacterized alkaline shock family protein YloU